MSKISPNEIPPPCKRCTHRSSLYRLLGVIFCDHSKYTCVNRTKPCDEFQRDYGKQLELF